MLLSFLFLILATLCRMSAHEYVMDQHGNRSIEFNLLEKLLTGFETQLLGLENRLEKRIVGLET
jgi:hypothetical protein